MTGQTANTSQLFEHRWYEWVKFFDSPSRFPEDKDILGRYLGPSLDVGSAKTAKILKAKGNTIHVSTYRNLTKQEYTSKIEQQQIINFTEAVNERLGPSANIDDLTKEFGEEVLRHQSSKHIGTRQLNYIWSLIKTPHKDFDTYIGA